MPRISIGMPVFNGEKYIAEAIDSILAQTFADFELIISDNGSKDGTLDICKRYAARDARIRLEQQKENRGAAWNYNRVFALSEGDYFKWCAHDDAIAPSYLQRCLDVLDQYTEVVLCYPQTQLMNEHGGVINVYPDGLHLNNANPVERLARYLFRQAKKCNPLLGLIRRKALARTSLIGSYNASDQVLLAHLALLGEFHEIPEPLMFRRDHPGASLRANRTAGAVAAWFNPKQKGRFLVPTLRHGWEYLRCIRQADLPLTQQIQCARLVSKRLWWDRHQVVTEFKTTLGGVR
ncbi:glycosyltransferase [Desulfuromonas sp. AOP6]|uniref:glycosyltransferase family 2 protein n=1 Tax=Desulfuromonas sp. AOP6 TaxID=1566351 RepID=UPI0012866942|nr:glycosyltransferase [Desulfuromonas sp. AOP6]BCA79490.1 glycosyl transferase [Desulfuromonas sp. AOP6]